jgi:hypothetical protein
VIQITILGNPFDIVVVVEVKERCLGNHVTQKESVRQFLGRNVLLPVAFGFFPHFVGPLVKQDKLAVVQQFLKPEEFRILLVRIPDDRGEGEPFLPWGCGSGKERQEKEKEKKVTFVHEVARRAD